MYCPALRELIETYLQKARITAVLPAIFSSLNTPQVQTVLSQSSSLRWEKKTLISAIKRTNIFHIYRVREQEINHSTVLRSATSYSRFKILKIV